MGDEAEWDAAMDAVAERLIQEMIVDRPVADTVVDESIRDVVSDDLVRRVDAQLDVDCDHQVCWVRAVVEAVLPMVAADEVLLARVRAVHGG